MPPTNTRGGAASKEAAAERPAGRKAADAGGGGRRASDAGAGGRRASDAGAGGRKPAGGRDGAGNGKGGGEDRDGAGGDRSAPARAADWGAGPLPFDSSIEPGGAPASRRALRNQGRRTMRKLLDAAMEAFDSRGYHATRVNDVVEIAKTSHGTFYLYFSNKEDLLRALVAEAAVEAAEVYAAMAEPPQGGTDWQYLREWVGQYSALWVRYAPLVRAWTDLAAIDPELGVQIRQSVTSMSKALARQIGAARPVGRIDPDSAGMAVLAMLDRFHYLREFVGQPVDDVALDTLATMVHRALFDGGAPDGADPG